MIIIEKNININLINFNRYFENFTCGYSDKLGGAAIAMMRLRASLKKLV